MRRKGTLRESRCLCCAPLVYARWAELRLAQTRGMEPFETTKLLATFPDGIAFFCKGPCAFKLVL